MNIFSSSFSPPPPFQEELMHEDPLFWDFSLEPFDLATAAPRLLSPPLEPLPVVPRSAFMKYVRPEDQLSSDCSTFQSSNYESKNIHRKVIEFLRRNQKDRRENRTDEYSRGFRHMMRERVRRERLRQNYADLHSMLPYKSKADKKSIVQAAATYVEELKGVKEELLKRNEELEMRNARNSNLEGAKIKISMANPISTVDSVIGALQCLKAMDAKASAIQTEFSGHELSNSHHEH